MVQTDVPFLKVEVPLCIRLDDLDHEYVSILAVDRFPLGDSRHASVFLGEKDIGRSDHHILPIKFWISPEPDFHRICNVMTPWYRGERVAGVFWTNGIIPIQRCQKRQQVRPRGLSKKHAAPVC